MAAKLAMIAFGGNALLRAGQKGTFPEQLENVERTCENLVPQEAVSYLRTIAMADNQVVSFFQERHRVLEGALHIFQLFGEGTFLPRAQQGVAPKANHSKLSGHISLF